VEVRICLTGQINWISYAQAGLGVSLWALLNLCYSIAVFTNPGSPLDVREDWGQKCSGVGISRRRKNGVLGYEGLPTHEDEGTGRGPGADMTNMTTVTAKSTGQPRYCQKCRCVKPDRAHHCSSCGRCVLKMDHHCPWVATCVGLRNYKPFLLFLLYTSVFCWLCFGVSAVWVWTEVFVDQSAQSDGGWKAVNGILLAVLGGIMGLVLTGFTGWHVYLAITGQTTIESLERTRYLSPLRKSLETPRQHAGSRQYLDEEQRSQPSHADEDEEQSLADRIKQIHANALPSILQTEEGEEPSRPPSPPPDAALSSSPAKESLHRSYASLEAARERARYEAYLDEQDSEKLPNAFDLGWRRNLQQIFGDSVLWWALPVCNSRGDGWWWEINPSWVAAREEVARDRARREQAGWNGDLVEQRRDFHWRPGQGFVGRGAASEGAGRLPPMGRTTNSGVDFVGNGHLRSQSSDADVQMQPLDRRKTPIHNYAHHNQLDDDGDSYDTSSDEDVKRMYSHPQIYGTGNWNDVPDEYLSTRKGGGSGNGRSTSHGRRKGD